MDNQLFEEYIDDFNFTINNDSLNLMIDLISSKIKADTHLVKGSTVVSNLTGDYKVFVNNDQNEKYIWEDFKAGVKLLLELKKNES